MWTNPVIKLISPVGHTLPTQMTTNSIFNTRGNQTLANTLSLSIVILASLIVATPLVVAQNPGFTVSASPVTLCVNPGITGRTAVSVSSVGGFSGTVNTGDSISPSVTDGPSLSPIPTTIDLSAGQTVSFSIDASTSQSTPAGTYTITVVGLSGTMYRQAQYSLVVSNDCSVGGVIVPTGAEASTGSYLVLEIAIAGIVAIVGAGLVLYLSRSRSRAGQIPLQKSVL